MPVQVLPEHYAFERYDHLRRWDSYWHQIRAAMRTGARSVLEIGGGTGVFRGYLERAGITVARSLVGNYMTSLDMAGCSVTLLRVDDTLVDLWDAPVNTPGLRWGV